MKDVAKMTDEERSKLFPIILAKHNPEWKSWYKDEKENILANSEGITAIHHYGSTAVPGIMSKPTVDILIEVKEDADLETLKQNIIGLGYNYMTFGAPPSMMFVKGYTPQGFAKRVFHIHVYYCGLQKELLFRDYLISHPITAKEYELLKTKLKKTFEFDRDKYTAAKTEFISAVTNKALDEYNKAKA